MEGYEAIARERSVKPNIYWYERISSRIFLFGKGQPGCEKVAGVIEGDQKNLIIDGGAMLDDEAVDYICAILGQGKPLLHACTHGHSFPRNGYSLFDAIYLNGSDCPMLSDKERSHITEIDEGDRIDLGGISFWPISISLHTPGSLAFLSGEENLCFTGDSIDRRIYITEHNREAMIRIRDFLMRFSMTAGETCRLISGRYYHHLMDIQTVRNLAAACFEVALRKTNNDIPLNGKKEKRLMRHSVLNTEIVYDSKLIWT